MTLWVLDTDHLSLLERGNSKIQSRLQQIDTNSLAITIVTAEEKVKGRLAAITLSVDGVLVTRNRRDFERVAGLQMVDWS